MRLPLSLRYCLVCTTATIGKSGAIASWLPRGRVAGSLPDLIHCRQGDEEGVAVALVEVVVLLFMLVVVVLAVVVFVVAVSGGGVAVSGGGVAVYGGGGGGGVASCCAY